MIVCLGAYILHTNNKNRGKMENLVICLSRSNKCLEQQDIKVVFYSGCLNIVFVEKTKIVNSKETKSSDINLTRLGVFEV